MGLHSLLAFRERAGAEWITIKQGMQTFSFFFLGKGWCNGDSSKIQLCSAEVSLPSPQASPQCLQP